MSTSGHGFRYHDPDPELQVLVYRDEDDAPGEWIAVALEMDLRGYGDTEDEALAELKGVVEAHISYALFDGDLSTILFPAEKRYFDMYEQIRLQALGDLFSSRTPSSPPGIRFMTVPLPEVLIEMNDGKGYEEDLGGRIPSGADDSAPVA